MDADDQTRWRPLLVYVTPLVAIFVIVIVAMSAGWAAMLESKGWANTYLAGADFDAQLAKEIEATTAVLKDIGLVQ